LAGSERARGAEELGDRGEKSRVVFGVSEMAIRGHQESEGYQLAVDRAMQMVDASNVFPGRSAIL